MLVVALHEGLDLLALEPVISANSSPFGEKTQDSAQKVDMFMLMLSWTYIVRDAIH